VPEELSGRWRPVPGEGKKLVDSGVETQYYILHRLALAERDSGHPEVAVQTFLNGRSLSKVIDPAILDQDLNGHYYGNIGRCLQFMGQTDSALACYQKSALLIEERDSRETVLNQGYIRYWIGEVLLARGQRSLAEIFLLAAYAKWRHVSPPKAEKIRFLLDELRGVTTPDDETDEKKAERTCLEWIHGQEVDQIASSASASTV
jgi:tetratricopeptide (TPR) repeat protein